jgi:guanylate kinase
MIRDTWPPILMIVSAPSGAGKTTLCDRLAAEFPSIVYSVSCTTRPPRVGEVDGRSYHFLTEERFEERRDAGELLEYANVHGHWSGTLRSVVTEALTSGRDVLMDIDVQGAGNVRSCVKDLPADDPLADAYVDVFIAPPSIQDLQLRLFGRGKDDADVISRRMEEAEAQLARAHEYQYLVVNDKLDESYDALRAVFLAEHQRIRGRKKMRSSRMGRDK